VAVRDPDAVREVLHRPLDFGPANALIAVTPLSGQAMRMLQHVGFALPPVLASNNTDSHAGIRKVVAAYLTPATVASTEPRIRELARESAARAAEQLNSSAQVELVQAVAAFPPAVIMLELLGLPVRDLARLKSWSIDSLELFWGCPDQARQLELAAGAADFYSWLRELVLASVDAPGRNLFKSLAGHGLSTLEICSLGFFLLIAGQETTTQLISTALFRLAAGSGTVSWDEAATEAGARATVRAVLAAESPVPTWRRVATEDTLLGDQLIPAGAEILLELTGNHSNHGNHSSHGNPAVSHAYSLAFGSGIHRCLGAGLAELEATVIVQETAASLPGIRLQDQQPDWIRLLSFQAPRTVLIAHPPSPSVA
jgi:cytochrome P450